MWPFKKKPEVGIAAVPEEIQDYYAAEKRGRAGLAWLLALATLLTTLALAAALFFGGRWAYHKIHHRPVANPAQPSTPVNTPSQPVATPPPPKSTDKNKSTPAKPSHKTTKKVASKPSTKPVVVVSRPKNLSNTGPGNILGIFVVTTLVASTGHYVLTKKKLS